MIQVELKETPVNRHQFSLQKALLLLLLFPLQLFSQESPEAKASRMQWFSDAKLGIFVHYGIYAVNGIDESWSFHNGKISHEDYMKQLNGFTAKNYDPAAWADLFSESGAKYAVMTSMHHDGVALWDSKVNELNVLKKTPAKRDLLAPYCKAMRDKGLKVGLYYSLLDWSHPDYPEFLRDQKRYEKDSLRWNKFLGFLNAQLDDLGTHYKPDLWWFDGDWEQSAEKWKAKEIREKLFVQNPKTIINSRLQGYGDYDTPEQGIPIGKQKTPYWELCMTINDSWGYQPTDIEFKSPNEIIRIFADCISLGGNMLLDVGPKEDGTIPAEEVAVLKELGRWTKKHAPAIYGTKAGIPRDWFSGPSTLSADSTKLYLFVEHKPNGPLFVKGLKNNVRTAWVVGKGNSLNFKIQMKAWWSQSPGLLLVDVPDDCLDPQITVICVSLEGKLKP
ncbi:MAG: alpha-L-fucosidase [Bacteroidota bacterium]